LNDPLLKECRVCGGALKKVVSSPAIQFKGSGFYITDYAKKSSPERTETKKEAAAESSPGSGKDSTDKKPPAPPPSKD